MRKILASVVQSAFRRFGLRLARVDTLEDVPRYQGIKDSLTDQLARVEFPNLETDPRHAEVAARAIASFRIAIATESDPVFGPSGCWEDVYASSLLRNPDLSEDSAIAEALYYGCRNSWLETTSPGGMVQDLMRGPNPLQHLISTRLAGREFLRQEWSRVFPSFDPLNRRFSIGQPLEITSEEGEVIGDWDALWYYALRLAEFSPLLGSYEKARERPVFMDLGGGSGRLAWVLKQMVPNATVVCCDLPETLLGSSYRLEMAFPEAKVHHFGDDAITTVEDLRELDFVFIPGFDLESLPSASIDVVTNTMSLSEMTPATIARYIPLIQRALVPGTGVFYTVNRSVAKTNRGGHIDVPLADYPVSEAIFETLSYTPEFKAIDHFFDGSVQNGEAIYRLR